MNRGRSPGPSSSRALASTQAGRVGRGWFCGNPDCELHVRVGDQGVCGAGEWAVRGDGVVTSRAVYRGRVLCDLCGRNQRGERT